MAMERGKARVSSGACSLGQTFKRGFRKRGGSRNPAKTTQRDIQPRICLLTLYRFSSKRRPRDSITKSEDPNWKGVEKSVKLHNEDRFGVHDRHRTGKRGQMAPEK